VLAFEGSRVGLARPERALEGDPRYAASGGIRVGSGRSSSKRARASSRSSISKISA
jgi:hypothetical protein